MLTIALRTHIHMRKVTNYVYFTYSIAADSAGNGHSHLRNAGSQRHYYYYYSYHHHYHHLRSDERMVKYNSP
jgi:hypothetical protein